MVKLSAPAMSMGASGKLGGAMVFSSWKGRSYARALVTPSNPKSVGQVGMRSIFKFTTQAFAGLLTADKSSWDTLADQLVASQINAFVKKNQERWRSFKAPSQNSSCAETGTDAVVGTTVATAGVRSITFTCPITTANDGWGVLLFRSPTGTFTTAWNNLIAVLTIAGTATLTYADSPLEPGTYYYNTRAFTKLGKLATPGTERNATVT